MKYHATPEDTRNFANRHQEKGLKPSSYRILGRSNLTVSGLGFGCYRIDETVPSHSEALSVALNSGCNLIDTSTNYSDGGSEKCVGRTLGNHFRKGTLKREEVVIVSKIGYVQGQNLDIATQREKSGNPYPEMVKYSQGCWHCIHPSFLADQLTLSLNRLSIDTLDVLLLHNPEYFLMDAQHRRREDSEIVQSEFYDRLRDAFSYLEEQVVKGLIQNYGVSSNTFGVSLSDPTATSLTRMLEIAQTIALEKYGDTEKHHFNVIQLPANLFEMQPMLQPKDGEQSNDTVLEYAAKNKIGVLINRPLNAFVGNHMIRLADFPVNETLNVPFEKGLEKIRALENTYREKFAPQIPKEAAMIPASDFFRWADEFDTPDIQEVSAESWSDIESQMLWPRVDYILNQLTTFFKNKNVENFNSWRDEYYEALESAARALRIVSRQKSQKTSNALKERLKPHLVTEEWKTATLSQQALGVLIHSNGISSVLNGMRRADYVDDSMEALRKEPITISDSIYRLFRK